jgi:hypothetical protein
VRPYLKKNPTQKRVGGMTQSVGPEFKLQYQNKTKQNKKLALVGNQRLR